MDVPPFRLLSVSWIDEKSVPKVGFWGVAGALISWPKRVTMGLVGTSNPAPPNKIVSASSYARGRQYRAMLGCTLDAEKKKLTDVLTDPGYTPPFDKSKLDTALRAIAPIPDDKQYYAGEQSAVSGIVAQRLHPSSTLILRHDDEVLLSALIKFRAGTHTDAIGIEKANSPVHVPWVWCEFALVKNRESYRLLGNGSTFPSHAWYVDGEQVAKNVQGPISVSERDPTLSTGQPKNQLQMPANVDKSAGPAASHQYAIAAGKQFDIPIRNKK